MTVLANIEKASERLQRVAYELSLEQMRCEEFKRLPNLRTVEEIMREVDEIGDLLDDYLRLAPGELEQDEVDRKLALVKD